MMSVGLTPLEIIVGVIGFDRCMAQWFNPCDVFVTCRPLSLDLRGLRHLVAKIYRSSSKEWGGYNSVEDHFL